MLKQLHDNRSAYKRDQDYPFWQEGFHPKRIQNESLLQNKFESIHNNPVEQGYVDDPVHWHYSSYRNVMELDAVVEIDRLL